MSNQYIVKPHLDGSSFYHPGNKTGFLLLHGFTATTTEVKPLAERLGREGYTVSAPLLPGHDTHPDDLNKVRWQDWYQTVRQAYLGLRESCDTVWLGGESMGAVLCLLAAIEFREAAGLLLFSPALRVKNLKAAYLMQYFKKYLDKSHKSNDQEWKGYNVYPMKGAVQLLKLQKQVKRKLGQVTQPTLVVVSQADKTVPVSAGEEIIQSISSPNKRLLVSENASHTMLLDEDNQQLIDQAIEFVDSISLKST
ncbi:MAG: alpha/beta fold hydrolase [Anaerolineaceae bacterium]|nr:alpha/beta fold hydrolase [Anaerolineaceae bacterium]